MSTAPILKYLFVAEYADGSFIEQTSHDVSQADPKRSAYFDIALKGQPDRFSLVEQFSETPNVMTVDLRDGQFEHNGYPFIIHDQLFQPDPKKSPLELIYFRETRKEITVGADGTVKEMGETYVNRYFIGWKTKNEKGRWIRSTVAIS